MRLGFSTGRLRCLTTWSHSSVIEDDHHARPVVCFPVFPAADSKGGDHASPLARRRRSGSHAKNDVHDAFDFTEMLRVEVEGDFDVFVVLPGDLEGEARGCELNEPQAVVAGVGIVIEGLDVADAAIITLELTLNEKIGLIGGRQIQVIVAGVLAIERDLEVFAAGLSDGHMFGKESHWRWPCFSDLLRPYLDPDCQKGRLGNGLAFRVSAENGIEANETMRKSHHIRPSPVVLSIIRNRCPPQKVRPPQLTAFFISNVTCWHEAADLGCPRHGRHRG